MSVLALRGRPSSPAARQRRALMVTLLRREIRGRYKGSALGVAWTFVLPISVVIAYSAIFHYVYKVVDIPDYPLFLLSGMVGLVLLRRRRAGRVREHRGQRQPGEEGALPAPADPLQRGRRPRDDACW